MLGDALLNAASRATSSAVDNISRHAMWYLISAAFLSCGLVFGLLVAYWLLEPRYGAFLAASYIGAACGLAGLVCLIVPSVMRWAERSAQKRRVPVSTTMSVVNDEAREAVDYFGAVQVVASAFMLGLGTARRLKGA